MMRSEFVERTGYEPDYEEYRMIEESYYEFPGDKDAFCKQWLKDKKDGHWDREYKLLKMLAEQKDKYEKELADKEDDLDFYRGHCKEQETKIAELRADVVKYKDAYTVQKQTVDAIKSILG